VSQVIVCDTGPLIHLSEANAIHLLKLAVGILIPPTVAAEFSKNLPNRKLPEWVVVGKLSTRSRSQIKQWVKKELIGVGEAEAIGLALQRHSDWLLTDDAQARQFAEYLGLEVHGSIGVLLWAVASGYLGNRAEAYQRFEALKRSSLWISDRVLSEAAEAIDELTNPTS
jgi:predicted nucleic acid-binding protein